jgi:hypothetical protein
MAGPAYYDAVVNIALNEDWIVPFVYGTYDVDGVTVIPFDLTGSVFKLEIRQIEEDQEAIVDVFSPNDGIAFFNNDPKNGGGFSIQITRAKLQRLFPGDFTIDLVRLMPSGWQERIFEGVAKVVTGTTR